jgi:hypothetical protein
VTLPQQCQNIEKSMLSFQSIAQTFFLEQWSVRLQGALLIKQISKGQRITASMMIESQAAVVQNNLGGQMNLGSHRLTGFHHHHQTKRVKQCIVGRWMRAVECWLDLLVLVKILDHAARYGQEGIHISHRELLFMSLLC